MTTIKNVKKKKDKEMKVNYAEIGTFNGELAARALIDLHNKIKRDQTAKE